MVERRHDLASGHGKKKTHLETRVAARAEDHLRLRLLDKFIAGTAGLDRQAAVELRQSLNRKLRAKKTKFSLASAIDMRQQRARIIGALLDATSSYADAELQTLTILNRKWALSPAALRRTSAASKKRQFVQHLNRAGISRMPGFLVAFLHGEFEPSSRRFILHYHVLTTRTKAAALLEGLRGRWGYEHTSSGAAPIRRSQLRNRPRQISYLLKSFWPERPIVKINGVTRRVRGVRRIKDRYHSLWMIWINRQIYTDITILNKCTYRGGRFFMK